MATNELDDRADTRAGWWLPVLLGVLAWGIIAVAACGGRRLLLDLLTN
jgi:hypothetical protein